MSRVLLVYHNALFAHSIHAALRAKPHIHLVGELEDWTRVEVEIKRLSPDVVLVEEDEVEATDAVLSALRACKSQWKVVALRLDETTMHIWSGAGKELQRPQDLYSALDEIPGRRRKNPRTSRRSIPEQGGL